MVCRSFVVLKTVATIAMVSSLVHGVDEVLTLVNDNVKNETARYQPTTPGIAIAYTSVLVMALFPITFGAFKSAILQRKQKESGGSAVIMTRRDAVMFPVLSSATLFGLYLQCKLDIAQHAPTSLLSAATLFNKSRMILLLTCYVCLLGALALARLLSPFFSCMMLYILPHRFHAWEYRLTFERRLRGRLDMQTIRSVDSRSISLAVSPLV